MNNLLAIDPGECTGFATFQHGVFCWAGVTTLTENLAFHPDRLVIEIPNAHESKGKTRSKRDPQAIITLAVACGQWIRHISAPDTVRLFPSQWKGQVPKPVHNARVLACLTPSELKAFQFYAGSLAASKLHNVIDAIGLGLFNLGRMQRGRAT